jgi:TolB-like protein
VAVTTKECRSIDVPGSTQEYFSDGLAEEIINALAQIAGLKVIARTSASPSAARIPT